MFSYSYLSSILLVSFSLTAVPTPAKSIRITKRQHDDNTTALRQIDNNIQIDNERVDSASMAGKKINYGTACTTDTKTQPNHASNTTRSQTGPAKFARRATSASGLNRLSIIESDNVDRESKNVEIESISRDSNDSLHQLNVESNKVIQSDLPHIRGNTPKQAARTRITHTDQPDVAPGHESLERGIDDLDFDALFYADDSIYDPPAFASASPSDESEVSHYGSSDTGSDEDYKRATSAQKGPVVRPELVNHLENFFPSVGLGAIDCDAVHRELANNYVFGDLIVETDHERNERLLFRQVDRDGWKSV